VRRNRLKARERLERLVGRGRTAKLNLGPIDAEETMMLPQFRFHPTAFAEGRVFEQTDEACAGCGRSAGWRYVGPLYARQKVQPCPDCIANGRVAAFVGDANFSFFDTDLREVGPEWQEELLRRTPGFAVFIWTNSRRQIPSHHKGPPLPARERGDRISYFFSTGGPLPAAAAAFAVTSAILAWGLGNFGTA
jgi:hypothetical protein